MTSVIAIDRDVLDGMVEDGDVRPEMWDERLDGRVNLRLAEGLRRKLDALVVSTGLDYSEALRRLRLISKLTPTQRMILDSEMLVEEARGAGGRADDRGAESRNP